MSALRGSEQGCVHMNDEIMERNEELEAAPLAEDAAEPMVEEEREHSARTMSTSPGVAPESMVCCAPKVW